MHASERGRERAFDADAVVVAVPAPEALRVAGAVLCGAEREALARVRYAPKLALVLGLRRALHPHPRWLSVPRSERAPLASVVLEPGVTGGRVPSGRGLALLEATPEYAAAANAAPDDVLAKELLEAFEGLLAGARGAAAWTRLYRLPLATPRFDVGRYREIARFERVERDQRARAGRALLRRRLPERSVLGRRAALRPARCARRAGGPRGAGYGSSRAIVTPSPPSSGSPRTEAGHVGRLLASAAHRVAQRPGADAVHDRDAAALRARRRGRAPSAEPIQRPRPRAGRAGRSAGAPAGLGVGDSRERRRAQGAGVERCGRFGGAAPTRSTGTIRRALPTRTATRPR